MILSFGDSLTEDVFNNANSRRVLKFPKKLIPVAQRKLDMINAATELKDLESPPGNRLEPLRGKLKGFHSIRANVRWRVMFRWVEDNAHDVQLIDYHS